jgi:predicted transcriptional regulator/transcriptional regulator with XRE-family HTH domain
MFVMLSPEARTAAESRLGGKVRALRRRQGLTQAQLAQKLAISPSYLNLIESNRRPLPAPLLLQLAQLFQLDLAQFAPSEDARLQSELLEVFSDPLLEADDVASTDVRELAEANPAVGKAVLALYRAYQEMRTANEATAARLAAGEEAGPQLAQAPSEEVSDLLQEHLNHFPDLEHGAETLWRKAKLSFEDRFGGLSQYLEKAHGVQVRVVRNQALSGVLRRYDPKTKILALSELLPTRSRMFEVAHQLALLQERAVLDRVVSSSRLSTPEAQALARVALANYFAAAVLMPYDRFLEAAREERCDLDILGRRFGVGFEQACHRLTTLRRPGAEGIPFHMLRIDMAGNLSKRFSASGIRFARFSGACPRWNIFQAFMTPGMIRIQLSRMPDGCTFFCIARTIQRDSGGFHSPQPVMAIGLGCQVQHAREMVYADGMDLENLDIATPVGVTCRLCERTDCDQRAFPSLRHPLHIDENVRTASLFSGETKLRTL